MPIGRKVRENRGRRNAENARRGRGADAVVLHVLNRYDATPFDFTAELLQVAHDDSKHDGQTSALSSLPSSPMLTKHESF